MRQCGCRHAGGNLYVRLLRDISLSKSLATALLPALPVFAFSVTVVPAVVKVGCVSPSIFLPCSSLSATTFLRTTTLISGSARCSPPRRLIEAFFRSLPAANGCSTVALKLYKYKKSAEVVVNVHLAAQRVPVDAVAGGKAHAKQDEEDDQDHAAGADAA